MPRIIELLRQSAVPPGVMRTAAKGELSLPPGEMVEVLVYLAEHSPNVAEEAHDTLSKWRDEELTGVLANPNTPYEVLNYFLAPRNRRLNLLGVMIENPSVRAENLAAIAESGSREIVTVFMSSDRTHTSVSILRALLQNAFTVSSDSEYIKGQLALLGAPVADDEVSHVFDFEIEQWIAEHAAEIKAEEGKTFALVGGIDGTQEAAENQATEITPEVMASAATGDHGPVRLSTLQKLAKMTVGERVQAAMKGSKDERYILIRDGSKVVSTAVLASPKLSEAEVETFASMKNVQENVLRGISRNRKFMKNYIVVKNLANNPRTPLDLSLGLIKNMTVTDLKLLSSNKNVPDTLRKMSYKLFKMRSSPSGKAEY